MAQLICSFLLSLMTTAAFAWGPEGHQIVAQIAEDHLLPAAHASVSELLQNTKLADVATWADVVKTQPQFENTKSWHFLNVADGQAYDPATASQSGNVVSAITTMVNTLKNKKAPLTERQNALKFLVHFVGDIHQPLHVGRADDQGGNLVKVSFEGRATNLHALWDTSLITKENLDFVTYSRQLEAMKESYDLPEFSFSQIIQEGVALRTSVYDFPKGNDGVGIIDAAYFSKNVQPMNNRLLLGGMRLAKLLNAIL